MIKNIIDYEKEHEAARLRGSLLEFMKFFYEHITGRKFIVSQPIGRESHHVIIAKELTKVFNLETLRLIINVPPGHNKSTMMSLWIAWCWTHYPDSNFLYISYSEEHATKHTAFIKRVVSSRMYNYLFDVFIDPESKAKGAFRTTAGGTVLALGSQGSITGQDAGLLGVNRASGAIVIDDSIKIKDAPSDTIRDRVNENYRSEIVNRCRGGNVPIACIQQRTHEGDLPAFLMSGKDIYTWKTIILPGLDAADNALYPEFMAKEELLTRREKDPYNFAALIQQDPSPAGGALFRPEWFIDLPEDPIPLVTFVTVDTAETPHEWNDASAFSFWSLYEIEEKNVKTGIYALHWLDCEEIRVEPAQLEDALMAFYSECMRYRMPPSKIAIEQKSTGTTLLSVLKQRKSRGELRGVDIIEIKRNNNSGSKGQRFIDVQHLVSSGLYSFTEGARHRDKCVSHMSKITPNCTHRHDDIGDTAADAGRMALIEKTIYNSSKSEATQKQILKNMDDAFQRKLRIGDARYNGRYS